MGYAVSSITMIALDDAHHYFAYYVPTRLLRHEWINEFFAKKLHEIASRIGPEGVIIAPTRRAIENYLVELDDYTDEPMVRPTRWRTGYLHAGLPFLIVSRRPLHSKQESTEVEAVALNLAAARDEAELSALLDTLIEAGMRDGWQDVVDLVTSLSRDLDAEEASWWLSVFRDAVEIKPNVFGMGINVGGLAKLAGEAKKRRLARRLKKEIGRSGN